ncbi:MAG TPA: putative sulfate exporter family transporter [Erysipelothrix sp.]|nr:putative sulfate exporter family transporter [Erysipelothrix sp.]
MHKVRGILPGVVLAVLMAGFSQIIINLGLNQWIGASVLALFLGLFLNTLSFEKQRFIEGTELTRKYLLRLAIILMGATFQIKQVVEVGKISILVMFFTLLTAFLGGHILGKVLKIDWKLTALISSGTGVCGGSAIAALAPTIEAKSDQISYAMSVTFLFDVAMVILFPLIGHILNMSDIGFGLWTGTAINDTSSVVAAGYAYSNIAGDYALIVKLTRTLSIIPIVIIYGYIYQKNHQNKLGIKQIFPWFIVCFLGMVLLRSVGIIPNSLGILLSKISKFLMTMALFSVGFNTDLKSLRKLGYRPMMHGVILSILVVIVSLLVQMMLGQM